MTSILLRHFIGKAHNLRPSPCHTVPGEREVYPAPLCFFPEPPLYYTISETKKQHPPAGILPPPFLCGGQRQTERKYSAPKNMNQCLYFPGIHHAG
jgi:hypothetical protein